MGKQTDANENNSSKKKYSFTGHRTIGSNKSQHINDSDSNTTEDMLKILQNDNHVNNNFVGNNEQSNSIFKYNNTNQMQNPNQMMSMLDPLQMQNMMESPQMQNMTNPQMQNMTNPQMQNMTNPQMQNMIDPQMQNMIDPQMQNMMNSQMQNMMNPNQFMGAGDIDPLLVNTFAPINNMKNNFTGFENSNLLSGAQMAQNLSGLANLSKLGNTDSINNYFNQMSETNTLGMNNNTMGMANNTMGMNNNTMTQDKMLDVNSLKNLASLKSMNVLKY